MAILDSGISFGGGNLCSYGINSNTSANSFLKCILRKYNNLGKQVEKLEKERAFNKTKRNVLQKTVEKVKKQENDQPQSEFMSP